MFVALDSRTININRQRASTLLELLIALTIVTFLVGAVVALSMSSGRSFAEIMNYIDMGRGNQFAVDRVTKDLRQMKFLQAIDTNALTFVDMDGSNVVYSYSPQNRSLTRTRGALQTTLLTDCDTLQFAVYERPPLTNTFDLVTASDVTNCKVVSLSWSCSRSLFGRRAHTETAQTTRIVLRNRQDP